MTSGAPAERNADKPNWWQRAIRSGTGQAIRWLAVLGLVLWRWADGVPSHFSPWLPVLIVSVLLLLPDADSVAFGGVKLEMRRAREEVEGLRQQVTQLQVAQAREAAAAAAVPAEVKANEEAGIEPYDPGAP
jgi:hypothetical protein